MMTTTGLRFLKGTGKKSDSTNCTLRKLACSISSSSVGSGIIHVFLISSVS